METWANALHGCQLVQTPLIIIFNAAALIWPNSSWLSRCLSRQHRTSENPKLINCNRAWNPRRPGPKPGGMGPTHKLCLQASSLLYYSELCVSILHRPTHDLCCALSQSVRGCARMACREFSLLSGSADRPGGCPSLPVTARGPLAKARAAGVCTAPAHSGSRLARPVLPGGACARPGSRLFAFSPQPTRLGALGGRKPDRIMGRLLRGSEEEPGRVLADRPGPPSRASAGANRRVTPEPGLAGSRGRSGRGAPKCGDPGGVAGRLKDEGVAL